MIKIYNNAESDTVNYISVLPLCEIMRDKWLANRDFDCVRDTDEFKAVLNKLTR